MDQEIQKRKEKIPSHWEVKRLGEVFIIERGGSPRPIEDFITTDKNGINWIKIGDTKNVTKYIHHTQEKIKPEGAKRSRIVNEDDFILSNSMSFGRPYIMKTSGCIHDGWLVIRKNEIINNDFLYYILSSNSLFQQFSNLAKGSTVKNLNIEAVKKAIIQFPPLAEQQTIVAKIEELFSELEKGKEQLETALAQLKVYRQSLLQAAFTGKLTNPDVKEGELPKGWKWVKLGDVSKLISGFAFKSSDFVTNGVPVVKISNIGYSEFIWKDQEYLDDSFLRTKNDFIISGGDLLIALTRPITNNTTKVCLYPESSSPGLLNQRVAMIKDLKAEKKFVYLFMQSTIFKEFIRSKFSETLQPNLSPKDLTLTPFPLCTQREQLEIVQILESKLTVCDKIEETIKQSIAQAEVLRQSILKQAFEGKLVEG
jgi:type I restriction enzyme S subunit